nr:SCO6880 family protein [Pedococcus sp. 5OH_020]
MSAPLWLSFVALAFAPWNGGAAVETLPTAGHFLARRVRGQTRFLARPDAPRPAGTLALPGDACALRFHIDGPSGAAMVHDPHEQTLTAVALIQHPAYVLLSPEEQGRRVHGWSRSLATLANGSTARIQVLESSLPDSGRTITDWWQTRGSEDNHQWAVHQYQQLMRRCAPSAATHRTLIAIAIDLKAAAPAIRRSGRGITGAAAVLSREMDALGSTLIGAELRLVHWLDETQLARTLLGAYDPGIDQRPTGPLHSSLSAAGPMAIHEEWHRLRHDTGYSCVLWIREWPRVEVPSHFLHSLVFQPGVRRTLSITATPVPVSKAIRDIRRAKVEHATDAMQRARIGAITDLADAAELNDVLDRERALVAGHAELRFTGMVTITATTADDLEAAVAAVERAAIQCGCETRRLLGQQAQAFTAAALPLARRVS